MYVNHYSAVRIIDYGRRHHDIGHVNDPNSPNDGLPWMVVGGLSGGAMLIAAFFGDRE